MFCYNGPALDTDFFDIKSVEGFTDTATGYKNVVIRTNSPLRPSSLKRLINAYNEGKTNEKLQIVLRAQSEVDDEIMTLSRKSGESLPKNGFYHRILAAKERGDPTYVMWPGTTAEKKQARLQKALYMDKVPPPRKQGESGSPVDETGCAAGGEGCANGKTAFKADVGDGGCALDDGSESGVGSKHPCRSGNATEDEEVAPRERTGKRTKLVARYNVEPFGLPVHALMSVAQTLAGMGSSRSDDPSATRIELRNLENENSVLVSKYEALKQTSERDAAEFHRRIKQLTMDNMEMDIQRNEAVDARAVLERRVGEVETALGEKRVEMEETKAAWKKKETAWEAEWNAKWDGMSVAGGGVGEGYEQIMALNNEKVLYKARVEMWKEQEAAWKLEKEGMRMQKEAVEVRAGVLDRRLGLEETVVAAVTSKLFSVEAQLRTAEERYADVRVAYGID